MQPGTIRQHNNRAEALRKRKEFDRAIADYDRVIEIEKSAEAYDHRGDAWKEKGDLDRAIADYGEAIRLDPAYGWAYVDRGDAWAGKGDLDKAIADYGEVIKRAPKDACIPCAYRGRARAWRKKNDLDKAIADYGEAIKLKPKANSFYADRASAWVEKRDYVRAIADYDEAIKLDPEDMTYYFGRGRARLYANKPAESVTDLDRAGELSVKYAYPALWLDIAGARAGLPSRLAAAAAKLDMTKWPAPVVRLYLGQSTLDDLLTATEDTDVEIKKARVCEAHFYAGELALRQGNKNEAKRLLGMALKECPVSYVEHDGAVAELKALNSWW